MNPLPEKTEQEEAPEHWQLLAKAYSEGATNGEIVKLSMSLGLMPANLEGIKASKRFTKMIEGRVKQLALYATARNLPFMEELAKKNVGAFTALAKIAGAWPGSEVNINSTQINVGERSGDNESDRVFHLGFQQRLQSGLFQRLMLIQGGKMQHDPPVPFPDPEPPIDNPEPDPASGD